MFKALLISIVAVPVLLAIMAARSRRERAGLVRLIGFVLAYNTLFMLMLYYLRRRWLG
jgi:hypothetical protein